MTIGDDYEDYKYDEEMKQNEYQQAIFEDEPMQAMLHDVEQCEAKMEQEETDFLHGNLPLCVMKSMTVRLSPLIRICDGWWCEKCLAARRTA